MSRKGGKEQSWQGDVNGRQDEGEVSQVWAAFLHTCYAPISHFPSPPLPHSFFFPGATILLAISSAEEGIPSVVGCTSLWQDT